jgi:hypothetical protein
MARTWDHRRSKPLSSKLLPLGHHLDGYSFFLLPSGCLMFLIIYTFKLYFFISMPFQLCCRCVMSWILFHITCTHIYDTTNIITALQITLILRNTIMGGVRLQILTKKKKTKIIFFIFTIQMAPYSTLLSL